MLKSNLLARFTRAAFAITISCTVTACGGGDAIDRVLSSKWHPSLDASCNKKAGIVYFDQDSIVVERSDVGAARISSYNIRQIPPPDGASGDHLSLEFSYRDLSSHDGAQLPTTLGIQLANDRMIGRAVLQSGKALPDDTAKPLLEMFTRQICDKKG